MNTLQKLKAGLLAAAVLLGTTMIQAQVKIGSNTASRQFSVLELVSQYSTGSYGGLRLPQVNNSQRAELQIIMEADAASGEAPGLTIYNTDTKCIETWNGSKWLSLCDPCKGLADPSGFATNQSVCAGSTGIMLMPPVGTSGYKWYQSNQSTLLTTSTVLTAGTYYLSAYNADCETSKVPVSISVDPIPDMPDAPTAPREQNFCYGAAGADLIPSAGISAYRWYASDGITRITEDTPLAAGTYYVTALNKAGDCESARVAVSVTFLRVGATAPTITGSATACQGQEGFTYTATAVANATSYIWSATDAIITSGQGTPSVTVSFSQTAASATISVKAINACSEGATGTRAVTLVSGTELPVAETTQSFCSIGLTGTSLVPAAGTAGYKWYASNGTTEVTSSTVLTSGIYYLAAVSETCESPRLAVTVMVTTAPVAPSAIAQKFCAPALVSELKPTPSATTVWYTTASGGTELPTTDRVIGTTNNPLTAVTYYVAAKDEASGCQSERIAVNITAPAWWEPCPLATAQLSDVATINFDAKGVGCIYDARTAGYDNSTDKYNRTLNTYRVHQFGDAGVWLTENLRYIPQGGNEGVLSGGASTDVYTIPYYNFPGSKSDNLASAKAVYFNTYPEFGVLYNFGSATKKQGASDNIAVGNAGVIKGNRQGICPDGWVVPSDRDWNDLEKYIAENPRLHSTNTNAITWNHNWDINDGEDFYNQFRPNFVLAQGQSMKSPLCTVGSGYGASNIDGTGFNALLVGLSWSSADAMNYYIGYAYFWTSSTGGPNGWNLLREMDGQKSQGGVKRYGNTFFRYSLRCKRACSTDVPTEAEAPRIQAFCTSTTVTGADLTPAAGTAGYRWYNSKGGVIATTVLTSGTYYLAKVTTEGCMSDNVAVTVTVGIPPVPTDEEAPSAQPLCAPVTGANLKPAAGTVGVKWYTTSALTTEITAETVITGTRTYYVVNENDGCKSTSKSVTVTVTAIPSASAQIFCVGGKTVGDLTPAPSSTRAWFTTESGGTELDASIALLPDFNTYYLASKNGSCYSPRIAVNVVAPVLWTSATAADVTAGKAIKDARDNNYYRIQTFGAAGTWMVENLRYIPNNAVGFTGFSFSYADDALTARAKYYNFPGASLATATTVAEAKAVAFDDHPEYGVLYNWAAAINDASTIETPAGASDHVSKPNKGVTASTKQGICPAGWVLPSDQDWSDLEKAIAENPGPYSWNSGTTWDDTWRSAYQAYRPSSGIGHGTSMRSSICVGGIQNKDSKSNTDGTGLNVLLVGISLSNGAYEYGRGATFWTSTSENYGTTLSAAWARSYYGWDNRYPGVYRNSYSRENKLSVRCKKK